MIIDLRVSNTYEIKVYLKYYHLSKLTEGNQFKALKTKYSKVQVIVEQISGPIEFLNVEIISYLHEIQSPSYNTW